MCASLEAFSFLSLFSLVSISRYLTALVSVGQQRAVMQFWLPFTAAERTACLLQSTPLRHSNNISEYVVEPHFSHEIRWLMSFAQVESQYWCNALSALCCCSISSDCLFSEECTQAEQLGVRTVLIESEESVCCWRTDGSSIHSVVMAVWMIVSCACFSRQRKKVPIPNKLFKIAVEYTVQAFTLVLLNWVSSFSQQKYVLVYVVKRAR